MKKSVIYFSVCLFLMLGLVLFAQDVKLGENPDENKNPQTANNSDELRVEPVKRYKIEPNFKLDATWKESFSVTFSETSKIRTEQKIYEATFDCKVAEMQDSKPKKINFEAEKGIYKRIKTYTDPSREGSESIEEQGKTAFNITLGDNYAITKFKNETDTKINSSKVQNYYPSTPFIGFFLPEKEVCVDAIWTSDKITPLFFMKTDADVFTIDKSSVSFEKVVTESDVEFAELKWVGSVSPKNIDKCEFSKLSWERKIKYDLTNQRVVRIETTFTPEYDQDEQSYNKVVQKFEYPEQEKKAENKPAEKSDENANPQIGENTTPKTDEQTEPKTDEQKPEPPKKYKIAPAFTKDMTWKETIVVTIIDPYFSTEIEFTVSCKVSEYSDNKLKKITYESEKANVKSTKSDKYLTGNEKTETMTLGKTAFTADISDNFFVKKFNVTTKSELTSEYIQAFYPNTPITGIILPDKEISVGDEWSTGKILPIYFNEDYDEEFSIENTTIKLTNVKTENDLEIAEFNWLGSISIGNPERESGHKVTWFRTVAYDLTNQRILSSETDFKPEMDEGTKQSVKTCVKFDYDETQKSKDDDEPDKPKGEED